MGTIAKPLYNNIMYLKHFKILLFWFLFWVSPCKNWYLMDISWAPLVSIPNLEIIKSKL